MRLVKLSTAAAVAAGLATSASAVELSEAIQGVDVSGYVRYRMEGFGGDASAPDKNNRHKYKIRATATIPVNDQVNAVLMPGAGEAVLKEDTYGNANVEIIHAYFQYTGVENLTVQAGKQAMPTPFNDDEHGNGLVALYNAGPVTVAGGLFDSQNASTNNNAANTVAGTTTVGDNVMALGVIGSMDMVNVSAWYADHQNNFDAMTVAADMSMDMFSVGARHTMLTPKDDLETALGNDDAHTLTQINASANMDAFEVRAAYAMTGEDGATVGYETDAATSFYLENLTMFEVADSDAYKIGAGATFGKMTASLDYMAISGGTGVADQSEILPKVSYAMSDNFNVSLLHSIVDDDDGAGDDDTETQLEVKYTF